MGAQLDINEKAYDKIWDVNVKSTFFLIAECKDLMEKAGKANVCVISSVTGTHPSHMLGVYAMTKAALDNMVKWLHIELREDDIRVNAIAPGLIATDFSGPLW